MYDPLSKRRLKPYIIHIVDAVAKASTELHDISDVAFQVTGNKDMIDIIDQAFNAGFNAGFECGVELQREGKIK